MSWIRCTACGTHIDSARFERCPICGYYAPPVEAGAVAKAVDAEPAKTPLSGPPGEGPQVEVEAARDRTLSGFALAGGILLGLGGPGLIFVTAQFARGSTPSKFLEEAGPDYTVPLLLGFLIMLVVLAVYGANARAGDDPIGFTAGRVAKTALTTIGMMLAAGAVLLAAGTALLYVICVIAK